MSERVTTDPASAATSRARAWVRVAAGPRRRSHGFTLLEILVAFTVFVLVAVPSTAVVRNATRTAGIAGEHARAVSIARSRLDAFRALRGDGAAPETDGLVESAGVDYAWRVEVEPYVDESLGEESRQRPGIEAVSVIVAWSRGGRSREVALDTLVLVRR